MKLHQLWGGGGKGGGGGREQFARLPDYISERNMAQKFRPVYIYMDMYTYMYMYSTCTCTKV